MHNVLFVDFFFLPTEQGETCPKICILTYLLTYICPTSFDWKENTSKHLKGQLEPSVSDVTFLHQGQLEPSVSDVTFLHKEFSKKFKNFKKIQKFKRKI